MKFWQILLGLIAAILVGLAIVIAVSSESEDNVQKYEERVRTAEKDLRFEGD